MSTWSLKIHCILLVCILLDGAQLIAIPQSWLLTSLPTLSDLLPIIHDAFSSVEWNPPSMGFSFRCKCLANHFGLDYIAQFDTVYYWLSAPISSECARRETSRILTFAGWYCSFTTTQMSITAWALKTMAPRDWSHKTDLGCECGRKAACFFLLRSKWLWAWEYSIPVFAFWT